MPNTGSGPNTEQPPPKGVLGLHLGATQPAFARRGEEPSEAGGFETLQSLGSAVQRLLSANWRLQNGAVRHSRLPLLPAWILITCTCLCKQGSEGFQGLRGRVPH